MSRGWAYAAAAVQAAASPYPREPNTGNTYPSVRWEIATPASRRISAIDPWNAGAISERVAMTIPAFAQGIQIISGSCGAMPLWAHRGNYARIPPPQILYRPDPDVPSTVTWTWLYKDLVLHPYAWMHVTERYADGFPARMRYVPFADVSVTKVGIYVEGEPVNDNDIKRFDSPFAPGALANGVRVLQTAAAIEDAIKRFAKFDIPAGYLKQTGGPELLDTEIDDLLSGWEQARAARNTGFLNQSLDYQNTAFDARQLQLVEARQAIVQDIARLLNLPPMFVNAETGTSLTYSTVAQQQDGLQAMSLWPYLSAVRERLSMDDMTPRGTSIEIPSLGFMRTDLTGRAAAYQTLISSGILTVDEARVLEQLPPSESNPGRTLP